ncbi:uncharacterized protein KY384_007212 [Bacidia gigantensis]|uniref:uncharacterized protein n=1 Tax=Bacidia gigantensis TaxID=2732470 RepID=UPI001D045E65|nr:uncharacterized protein KY384_007212 [Bacidia gigantensis]KAG8528295.1 hypothetical protein KY384_007212 [Bacidia gigantensis]
MESGLCQTVPNEIEDETHAEDQKYTKWKYTSEWMDKHPSRKELAPLRHQYDTIGAAALERLQSIAENEKHTNVQRPRLDLYALLRDNHSTDPILHAFWEKVDTVPKWVDQKQLARGQKIFYRYAVANLTGFALQGFMGEKSGIKVQGTDVGEMAF